MVVYNKPWPFFLPCFGACTGFFGIVVLGGIFPSGLGTFGFISSAKVLARVSCVYYKIIVYTTRLHGRNLNAWYIIFKYRNCQIKIRVSFQTIYWLKYTK